MRVKPKSFWMLLAQTMGCLLVPVLLILVVLLALTLVSSDALLILVPIVFLAGLTGAIAGYSSMKVEATASYDDYETFRCQVQRALALRNYHVRKETADRIVFTAGRLNYDMEVTLRDGEAEFVGPRNNVGWLVRSLKQPARLLASLKQSSGGGASPLDRMYRRFAQKSLEGPVSTCLWLPHAAGFLQLLTRAHQKKGNLPPAQAWERVSSDLVMICPVCGWQTTPRALGGPDPQLRQGIFQRQDGRLCVNGLIYPGGVGPAGRIEDFEQRRVQVGG